MHLNHLNLAVDDVKGASSFLQTYFGLTPLEGAPATSHAAVAA